jgi:hypothetical protein
MASTEVLPSLLSYRNAFPSESFVAPIARTEAGVVCPLAGTLVLVVHGKNTTDSLSHRVCHTALLLRPLGVESSSSDHSNTKRHVVAPAIDLPRNLLE